MTHSTVGGRLGKYIMTCDLPNCTNPVKSREFWCDICDSYFCCYEHLQIHNLAMKDEAFPLTKEEMEDD